MYADFPVTTILRELERDNLLPAILFRTARRQCDADIDRLSRTRNAALSPKAQENLEREIRNVIDKFGLEESFITSYPQYQSLITLGVGAHHAGQLLVWRLLLEELMTRGLLRLMIATGTVAAGVDFPARSVIITAHSKRGSEGFNVITSSELQQMSGRAGRRGKDAVGLSIIAPSQFCDARVIREVSKRPPEPLRSAYFASPSTVLNLLKYRNVDDLRFTVSRSLAVFLDRKGATALRTEALDSESEIQQDHIHGEMKKKAEKRVRRKLREAESLERRQETQLELSLEGLRKLGYLEGSSLTEKGYWAAELCTSLVLELGEAVDSRLFDDLSLYELAGLVGSIAGDPHRNYFSLKANPIRADLYDKMRGIVEKVRDAYEGPKNSGIEVLPNAALTVITWLEAEDWNEFSGLLRLSGVADGDVARLISQTADHLNQITRLEKTHKDLADAAKVARGRLLRPPFSESLVG